jgi:hypothetical protein
VNDSRSVPLFSIFISPKFPSLIHSHPFLSIIIIGLAVRPLVVLMHELGHAIVARLIAKQKVSIFLGSHGNKESSAKISIGSLDIWFTANPFLWQCGLCNPSVPITRVDKRTSYILAGPILPVAISAIIADAAIFFEFNEYIRFISFVLLGISLIDLAFNLIPYSNPIAWSNQRPIYLDGYLLRLSMLQKKYPTEFFIGVNEYQKAEYADAALHFEKAARKMPGNKIIDRNLKECHRLMALQKS